ncbi:histidine kinase [Altererythrobacter aerius]|uniref:histidine kinase n=1 Tax=Tsuneonella aeria TaxID=1837929 RepID=A0A6I4TE71_9SPHN|nr:CHASE domain-containing protein [Tsuneonella aeria]MXO74957.1 histidine kinase [Tsuneonella aeria]
MIRPRSTRRFLVTYPRAAPLAIFLLIAAVTALSVFAIERGERRREEARLVETAKSIASAIERRGNTSAAYLRAGAALFGTVDAVPEALFRRFVSELRLDSDYRGAEGIGWAEMITADEIPAYESRIREQIPGFPSVRPAPSRPGMEMTPITYLLPDTMRNRRALGFDMYSEPVRRAAMDEAERMMRPTASGKVVLVQEADLNSPGFLIYMPVYMHGDNARRLKGFIYSPFNANAFLSTALQQETRNDMGIRLFDGNVSGSNLIAAIGATDRPGRTLVERIVIANRPMVLEVQSKRGSNLSILSLLTLLFGLLVASLLMIVARLLTQQAIEDQKSLEWLAEQNSIRDTLTRELNHRVKNTLANVLSIVSLTRRRATNLDEFAEGLDGRIRALSATHDLLTQSEWGTTPIRAVVEAELAPYARAEGALELAGPSVDLAPNDALSLGLAIHELATNAAKYGALSTAGGKVRITWALDRDDLASVRWVESGGPPVPQDRSRGFGTDLIEKIVAHELRNPVELEFRPEGVTCTLHVPVRPRSEFELRARRRALAAAR